MAGKKWTPAQRRKFLATLKQKKADKLPEQQQQIITTIETSSLRYKEELLASFFSIVQRILR